MYSQKSTPLLLSVSAILKQIVFAFAQASLTEKSQFFLPMTLGWMAFSAGLLPISIRAILWQINLLLIG
jgi:hypothetical protein